MKWLLAFAIFVAGLVDAGELAGYPETGRIERLSADADQWLAADAKVRVLAEGFKWTEGPLWIPEGDYLLFSDIPNNRVLRFDFEQGVRPYLEVTGADNLLPGDSPQGSNGMVLDEAGRLLLLQQGNRRIVRMDAPLNKPAKPFSVVAEKYQGKRLNSPNDMVRNPNGFFYFTDPAYGMLYGVDDPNKELAYQGVFRMAEDGELGLMDSELTHPNGIGQSPDGNRIYVAVSDAEAPAWYEYRVNEQGDLEDRKLFFDASPFVVEGHGVPDGMAVHSSGVIFATGPGGVWLFSPDATPLARIYTGRLTANCALSADEKILFITAHDSLMAIALK